MDINLVIQIILEMAKEAVVKNLSKSETVLRVLKKVNIGTKSVSNDFETIYVYTLIEYGVYKPKQILEFFRHDLIREAFKKSFYKNDPSILEVEADNIFELNNETNFLGYLDYDPRQELSEFSIKFRCIVNQARNPQEAEQFSKIIEIHKSIERVENIIESLKSETTTAQQIAQNQPEYWEFLLTLELLRTRLADIRRNSVELRRGLIFQKTKYLTQLEFSNWAQGMLDDLIIMIHILKVATTEELMSAWGAYGEPGNPIEIQKAVNTITTTCEKILEWEIELRFTKFPEPIENLKALFQGWAEKYLDEVEKIPSEIGRIINNEKEGTHYINLVFEEPNNIQEVNEAINKFMKR